jgi:hypothetical protein
VVLESVERVEARIEAALLEKSELDDDVIRVLVLTRGRSQAVIENRPEP